MVDIDTQKRLEYKRRLEVILIDRKVQIQVLAREIGICRDALAGIISGKRKANFVTMMKLKRYFNEK